MRRRDRRRAREEEIKKRNETIDKEFSSAKEKERVAKLEWNEEGVGGNHPAWDIIIGKLDYRNQWKISQQNKRLADVVATYAEYELRKFRREIQADKYM